MPTRGPDARIPNVQYFWEAFPSGSGPSDRTTYLFTYIDAYPGRCPPLSPRLPCLCPCFLLRKGTLPREEILKCPSPQICVPASCSTAGFDFPGRHDFLYMGLCKLTLDVRPSLEALLEEYWRLMPEYQGVQLESLEVLRILFGFFPTYRQVKLFFSPPHCTTLAL